MLPAGERIRGLSAMSSFSPIGVLSLSSWAGHDDDAEEEEDEDEDEAGEEDMGNGKRTYLNE